CVLTSLFFFDHPAPSEFYTLSLHDALPIYLSRRYGLYIAKGLRVSVDGTRVPAFGPGLRTTGPVPVHTKHKSLKGGVEVFIDSRSEEHTSELQSREKLVCRLLLEKKKNEKN